MLILDTIIYFKPWKKGKVFIYQVLPHLPINWSKVLCAIDFYRKMKFLLGALISWQQLIHEYLISPYSVDKNLRSRFQKIVQVWIDYCMYFFLCLKGIYSWSLLLFAPVLTGHMNPSWVFGWKTTILKCSHSKNIASQIPPFTILNCLIGKIYVGFFLSKTKNTVYFVVQYFTEKFWIDDYSYTKSIHNCPSNRYNICVVVWFIFIMVTFFANRDQCIAYFNNYYNSWNFETYIFRIFIQDFETDQ